MDRERRIRERAHTIWESEGRPAGREGEHWARAEAEIDGEESGGGRMPSAEPAERPATGSSIGSASPLEPGGTTPGGSPAAGMGSIGTGGGSTAGKATGSPAKTRTRR